MFILGLHNNGGGALRDKLLGSAVVSGVQLRAQAICTRA